MNERNLTDLKAELKVLGVGAVGLRTPEVKELVRILHPNERIGGVVYGRHSSGLTWLVATDKRILFLNIKPLFSTIDELTYDVVSGIKSSHAGLFTTVVLHTRVSDYVIRFVNQKCAAIFIKYIETRRLESGEYPPERPQQQKFESSDDEATNFMKNHDLAVLSTVDRTGNVSGAVVYYMMDEDNFIYILTRSGTSKGRNVYAHSQVALTVHEVGTQQTAQLQGIAEVETDHQIKNDVFSIMVKPRKYTDQTQLPPVTKLKDGTFTVIRITPMNISYHDYAKAE